MAFSVYAVTGHYPSCWQNLESTALAQCSVCAIGEDSQGLPAEKISQPERVGMGCRQRTRGAMSAGIEGSVADLREYLAGCVRLGAVGE